MSFKIKYRKPFDLEIYEQEWELNILCLIYQDGVIMLTATGEELDYIRQHFKNIPFADNEENICKWRGEWAQFILDNIP